MKWQWSQNFLHLLHPIYLIFIILVAWLIFFWFMLKNWHFCCEVVSTKVLHTPYILLKKPLKIRYDQMKIPLANMLLLGATTSTPSSVIYSKTSNTCKNHLIHTPKKNRIWSNRPCSSLSSSKINSWNHKRCEDPFFHGANNLFWLKMCNNEK